MCALISRVCVCVCKGKLSIVELREVITPFLTGPLIHHHNALLSCILVNTLRDSPPAETALWVTSSAPPAGPKPGTDNPTEHQLKREVMSISARERSKCGCHPVACPSEAREFGCCGTELLTP